MIKKLLLTGLFILSFSLHAQTVLNTPVTTSQIVEDPVSISLQTGFRGSAFDNPSLNFSAKINTNLPLSNSQNCGKYGKIVISEIYFDSRYNEQIADKYHFFGEYIELFNSSNTPVNVDGWVIKDNHTEFTLTADAINGDLVIPPGGHKIITYGGFKYYGAWNSATPNVSAGGAQSAIGGRAKFEELFPEVLTTSGYSSPSSIVLQNTMVLYNNEDKVSLYSPSGKLVDQVVYSIDTNSNLSVGDGSNAPSALGVFSPNGDGGVFNGPLGGIADKNPDGTYVLVGGQRQYSVIDDNVRKSIYRSAVESYYTGGSTTFAIGVTTPGSNPLVAISLLPLDPYMVSSSFGPDSDNSSELITYDLKSQTINGNTKTYFDDLGNPRVSMLKDFQTDMTWGLETLYDDFGRPWKESFLAPTCMSLDNNVQFLSVPVYKTQFLDKYYSDNNTYETHQATAEQTYSEINYDNNLNPGNVINAVGGNKIDNEWRTGYSYVVSAGQEMYYAFGYNHFEGPVNGGKEEVAEKMFKSVSVDANGVENVLFTDSEGKTLAAARSGGPVNYPVYSLIGTQGYVDVHIPAGAPAGTLLGNNAADYKVFDLKTGLPVTLSQPPSLASGRAYRVEAKNIPTTDPKVYVGQTPSGGAITYDVNALGVSYSVNYYEYTVNVYNKTGQLLKNIQPKGYQFNSLIVDVPAHMQSNASDYISKYVYNDKGQIVEAISPDEGVVRFAYRKKDGALRYTQNANQTNQISYVNYDSEGRPFENGVLTGSTNIWTEASGNTDAALLSSNPTKSEQTFSVYDYLDNYDSNIAAGDRIPSNLQLSALMGGTYIQENLEGRVVCTYAKTGTTINAITWYNYDAYGRVMWVVQYTEGLGAKTTHYEYDYKGNVSKVLFQKGSPSELFVHRYTYSLNGAMIKAETSRDNVTFITHADYSYYVTGELKRLNIGQGLQGLDYVYTLGGQLKSINHPSLDQAKDPGHDLNDVFGLILDYHNGDYQRANTNIASSSSIVGVNQDFNGNIKAARWGTQNTINNGVISGPVTQGAYMYDYNRDGSLTNAAFGTHNVSTGQISTNTKFKEGSLTYDANGNIKTLQRTDKNGQLIDNLTYNYSTDKNRLLYVTDAVNPGVTYDIDSQPAGNYGYDNAGQMTSNAAEGLQYYYNAQGLTTEIRKGGNALVKFFYNERGQRVRKESYNIASPYNLASTDYYALDATGNTMAIYKKPAGSSITQTEAVIYGLGRLGVYNRASNPTNDNIFYQVTDHQGNVRAILHKPVNSAITMIYISHYYPFGERLPDDGLTSTYRYAYQGQELDTETGMEAFELRLWDGRLGRWLNPDPAGQYDSAYLGMGNTPVNGIDGDGGVFAPFSPVGTSFYQKLGFLNGLWLTVKSSVKAIWYIGDTVEGVYNLGLTSVAASGVFGGYPALPGSQHLNTLIFDQQFGTNTADTYVGMGIAMDNFYNNLTSDDPFTSGTAFGELVGSVTGIGELSTLAKAARATGVLNKVAKVLKVSNSAKVVKATQRLSQVAPYEEFIEGPSVISKSMPKQALIVTEEMIANSLEGSDMMTLQGKVSLPMVQRYVTMLEKGLAAPPIRVSGNIIIEGNHRYVAGRIFGIEPPRVPYTIPRSQIGLEIFMKKTKVDLFDWGGH
ncbi:lamin tail domain-containing protein [Flavobacterium amniphilum]|uniref:lamin tail domain-containing protein n=1 Tax=Flavobacterium amniphilum TaxID=1834035 RepID=UPI00202A9696|nr:lamin tail domain-containing protein [Flavobacterium amniphilum]MCL9807678.1 lamin tail domain-containing protein [Flavobacterium amniphilum]